MLSYHNDPKIKELIVNEMILHQQNDQFIKGTYELSMSGKFKGCAVGCAIHSFNTKLGKRYNINDHKAFEDAIGVPEWLARLQDDFFEKLPDDESAQFAIDFLNAIPVGVNLEPVKWKFYIFLMNENLNTVSNVKDIPEELRTQVLSAIQQILNLYQNAIQNGKVDGTAWAAAISVAMAVEEVAIYASAMAAWPACAIIKAITKSTAEAANAASMTAATTACASWAAWAVTWAARAAEEDWDVAYSMTIKKYANKLLELLENCNVIK